MIVIHGENTIKSRNKLVEIIEETKGKNILVERVEAKNLDLPTLESKLQKTDLFGHGRMLVIEELHSLRRSKKKNRLIEMTAETEGVDICLWEKRKLTKNMLKKLHADKVYEFSLSNSLFDWLDSVSPQDSTKSKQIKLFRQAVESNDAYMCFIMLARQVRMLIQAKDGGKIKGPYFVVNKVKKQASRFNFSQLLKLHQQLHQIDLNLKTSADIVDLDKRLELLILTL